MEAFIYSIIALFGLVFGSFLNCAGMRIARREDFVHGRSRCMKCERELAPRDLIPLVSYAVNGGKCRYCKEKISIRYPLAELIFAGLSVGLYIRYGLNAEFIRDIVLTGCLMVLSIVDAEAYEIPDGCLIIGLIAWIATAPFIYGGVREVLPYMATGLVCGGFFLVMALIMDRVLKRESLGGGDIKLFALLGLYLGVIPAYILVVCACIAGIAVVLIKRIYGKTKDTRLAFGPVISVTAYAMLLFGEYLAERYLAYIYYG